MDITTDINTTAYTYLNSVFSNTQWREIETLVQQISNQPSLLEHVTAGVNKLKSISFSLNLHRFMMRTHGVSSLTDSPYATNMLHIMNTSHIVDHVSSLINKKAKILRMQLNIMTPGDFISKHTDQESDDAYLCSILIRTNSQYTGGMLTI